MKRKVFLWRSSVPCPAWHFWVAVFTKEFRWGGVWTGHDRPPWVCFQSRRCDVQWEPRHAKAAGSWGMLMFATHGELGDWRGSCFLRIWPSSIHLGSNYALSRALFGDIWSIYGTGLNVLSIPQWGQLGPRFIFAHQVTEFHQSRSCDAKFWNHVCITVGLFWFQPNLFIRWAFLM